MRPVTRIPAAIAAAFLALMACQKQVAKSPASDASAPAASPKPFTLTLSSGGGFAGLYHGCTLTSEGEAKAWSQRPGTPESVDWTRRAQPDSVLALARALEAFLAADLKETGNMTARVQYALPDSTYQWSISGAGASAEAPEPFRTWYARAEAYCRTLAPTP
jgi:hypothetical protein